MVYFFVYPLIFMSTLCFLCLPQQADNSAVKAEQQNKQGWLENNPTDFSVLFGCYLKIGGRCDNNKNIKQ